MDEVVKKQMERMGFSTVESRRSDALDFKDVSVWTAKAALEAAYEAGRKSAQEESR